jgi:effector-binding domain-containing protein
MSCLRKAVLIAVAAAALAGSPAAVSIAQSPPPGQSQSDPFGEEVTLNAETIVFIKGSATWDSAFETLIDRFKLVYGYLDGQSIKASGPAMTIYTATDDTGFQFQAAVPISQDPKEPPKGDIELGKSPSGKALKFIHRGSYDAMDTTYDAITNYLDEKKLEARELFIERYTTDILKTPEEQLVVEVFVPIK